MFAELMFVTSLLATIMVIMFGLTAVPRPLDLAPTPSVAQIEPAEQKTHSPNWEWYDEDGNRKYYPEEQVTEDGTGRETQAGRLS